MTNGSLQTETYTLTFIVTYGSEFAGVREAQSPVCTPLTITVPVATDVMGTVTAPALVTVAELKPLNDTICKVRAEAGHSVQVLVKREL